MANDNLLPLPIIKAAKIILSIMHLDVHETGRKRQFQIQVSKLWGWEEVRPMTWDFEGSLPNYLRRESPGDLNKWNIFLQLKQN